MQEWDDDSIHLAQHDALVGRDARLQAHHRDPGRRDRPDQHQRPVRRPGRVGRGASASTSPTPASTRSTACSSTTRRRSCISSVAYKGALQGDTAHTVWVGDVLIRAAAEGTDTYELNRNLVLTDGARADSVPNLEIETGEIVGAGHASATGRFDDEQLFYLQARGIPEDEARRLVVRGFFAEHRRSGSACPRCRST